MIVDKLLKMTVIGPAYRGADYPEFDPLNINEKLFDDGLRFKCYKISSLDIYSIDIDWVSQDWGNVNSLQHEIDRAVKENLSVGESIKVNLYISSKDHVMCSRFNWIVKK